MSSVVVVRPCAPEAEPSVIVSTIHEVLGKVPGIEERLARTKAVFIKINLGPSGRREYLGRAVEYVDPVVLHGVATWVASRTGARIMVGDGTDGIGFDQALEQEGHRAVIEELGLEPVDINNPPHRRFVVPRPLMHRWYDLSARIAEADFIISLAKMKSHHLCGVTLCIKNLFGLTPNKVYGSPRVLLHSAVRIPRVLADLLQLVPPDLCIVDGIVGASSWEWGGDPVASGVLIAGNDALATDAVAARHMGVDPGATWGALPFFHADNHLRLCAEHGLGSIAQNGAVLDGTMSEMRRPFLPAGSGEPAFIERLQENRRLVCGLAQDFFAQRERFVRDYGGQVISFRRDGTLAHGAVDEGFGPRFFGQQGALGHSPEEWWYRSFIKRVEHEEAELAEPYAVP